MPRYLIEVPHSSDECEPTALLTSGSAQRPASIHAYRGCGAGTHTTWIIARLDADSAAWELVPRLLRDTARVVLVEAVPVDNPDEKEEDK